MLQIVRYVRAVPIFNNKTPIALTQGTVSPHHSRVPQNHTNVTKANNIISNEVSFFLPFISGESNHLKVPVRVVSHISSTVHTR